ncbi:hypothetical protein [Dysgonomonas sp. 520]|uniref:hypothetical protein n=1 Tax=Dysgonomonas sp. 520 TaxID=2302931 RepID=UPI0013D30E6B|nr:hypothetical protein [Dysgonomonas sp. 520]NDW10983.1 hypothetical protein [Dysgonomonas sp. 520]
MGKYTVTSGQNLFDISMHIYGSIEGIVDLMMNNSGLSLADELKAGDELIFTDDFVINKDIVSYFRMNNLIPANGERQVYYKESSYPRRIIIRLNSQRTSAAFSISGNGIMEIDWGDNSPIEVISLENEPKHIGHFFNSRIASERRIYLYGDFAIKQIDLSLCSVDSLLLLSPVNIEKFVINDTHLDIGFFHLLNDTYDINLCELKTSDLLPLLNCKKLMKLDLTDADIPRQILDNYLIALVKQYYGRRNCIVTLTTKPSGEYKEPQKDENGNYILSSGMEAIWVLTNEPAWNEGGQWAFDINNIIYTYLPTSSNHDY